MGESKVRPPEEATEERTEPFSHSQMEDRLKKLAPAEPPSTPPRGEPVPSLDVLHVEDRHRQEGVRIIVRPYADLENNRAVSPGADNCRWLALRAEIASSDQPEHKVLAVTQTCRDIKFSVNIPGEHYEDHAPRPSLSLELYYDPASDKVVLLNCSEVPVALSPVAKQAASPRIDDYHTVYPRLAKSLAPGTWRIKVRDVTVMDFRILEKRPIYIYDSPPPMRSPPPSSVDSSQQIVSSTKRSLETEDDNPRAKRRLSELDARRPPATDDNAVVFMPPSVEPVVFSLPNSGEGPRSRELVTATSNALLEVLDKNTGDTVSVPGFYEVDQYELTKRDPIAANAMSAVYTAKHSRHDIVTVKVLKTRVPNINDKQYVHERDVIRQADMWLRETRTQEGLAHDSIVRYYGGDARFLSLYMEHVDAKDLTIPGRWRNRANDEFSGSRKDTLRIVKDIAGALSYLHGREKVHNDIKPANILYDPERGAVLCDFGMSTATSKPPTGGGTPYYIPPEFIGLKSRGPPSDVWALGVTLLYTLGKIPLPESRGRATHPRRLYWQIAGVNNPKAPHAHQGNGQPAADQMREWLSEITQVRESLNKQDLLERLVWNMLMPNPLHRITMADVMRQLQAVDAALLTAN
ncbi:hypothetical protein VHEMI05083 [[Torrubiella] hemipterigena]|uniref:Protein kinase domain-containing protein n=1 Tax=[Torrubiella] hemipterigena TaxID=1531966 RepID=A0A0A1TG77_9HYPO|nr:hypothetical protein VHEMI05083 [[Torrubiella] hemipterigena]